MLLWEELHVISVPYLVHSSHLRSVRHMVHGTCYVLRERVVRKWVLGQTRGAYILLEKRDIK